MLSPDRMGQEGKYRRLPLCHCIQMCQPMMTLGNHENGWLARRPKQAGMWTGIENGQLLRKRIKTPKPLPFENVGRSTRVRLSLAEKDTVTPLFVLHEHWDSVQQFGTEHLLSGRPTVELTMETAILRPETIEGKAADI